MKHSLTILSLVFSFASAVNIVYSGSMQTTTRGRPSSIQVGPQRLYKTPSAAASVAQDGDVVEIDEGKYVGDVAIWRASNLTIRGVGGRPHLIANGADAEGKGIWVIKGDNTTIKNIEFSGAKVRDRNGAGIRQEGRNLTVLSCSFHDNENGILAGKNPDSKIVIMYSEFAHNGHGDGQSHNLYIGQVGTLSLRYNYIHHAKIGHNVKTRAEKNYILYNRIMDEESGTSSYGIDVSVGGVTFIMGNLIQQGPDTDNWTIVAYGKEGVANPSGKLCVVNNTIVNDRNGGQFVWVHPEAEPAILVNNIFYGSGTTLTGPGDEVTNLHLTPKSLSGLKISDLPFKDLANYDYHLTAKSDAIDAGSSLKSTDNEAFEPLWHYVHPMGREQRTIVGNIDIGAYEYVGHLPIVVHSKTTFEFFPGSSRNG